ncbi:MAG: NAD-dependent epimerase/dehydratase family protein [Arenimonas sp.]
MARMKFTVLGGSGFVGTHLVKYLLAAGHEVVVPPRNASPNSSEPLGHVIYAIGLTGDFRSRPYDTIDAHVNILGHWLKESSFDSLLYLSSTRVYGTMPADTHEDASIAARADADSLYNLSKLLGESLCISQQRKDVRIARLSNIYGEGQNEQTFLGSLISSAAASKNILVKEDPESAKDYISVLDAVSCIEKIALLGSHQT